MTTGTDATRTPRRRMLRRGAAALLALALGVTGALTSVAGPAAADLGDTGALEIQKHVNGQDEPVALAPGDSFSYTIPLSCDDNPCIDAAINDALPPEFAGFTLDSVTASPSTTVVELTGCEVGQPLGDSCTIDASFRTPLGELDGVEQYGIQAGDGGSLTVTLTVPLDLGPDWEYNGATITNTASGSSTTAAGVEDDVDVVVEIDVVVDVATSKSWSVEELQYSPGSPVDLTVGVQNTSNAAAEQLVLQDPQIAEDGATALDPSNPFEYVDYAGLCSPSTLPTGADLVQVDLYVESGGVWNWVTGTPAATPTPPDVSGDVGGVRFTYTSSSGATISPGGTASEQCVSTTQRAETRDGVTFIEGAEVPNTAAGTVVVPGEDPLTTTADDSFTITGLDTVVTAGKTISPSQIAASQSFQVGVTGRNDSNGPLDTLTIQEPSEPGTFFSEDVTFAGFTGGTWPTTTESATFVWEYSDGTSTIVELEPGETPPDPTPPDGAYVTGFITVYRGVIEPGTTGGWDFQVDTSPDLVVEGEGPEILTNTVGVSGVNAAGSDDDTADAQVEVFFPTIDVELDKTIRPSVATPGGEVVVGLQASTPVDGVNVHPNTIVVEDVWDGSEDSFWNAFRLESITFTDVPAGSTLTVSVARGNPPVWEDEPVVVDATGVVTYDFEDPDTITGVRFTFENPDGFAQGTTVTPNLVFEASDELRTGGSTTEEPGVPVTYENVATAQASGDAGGIDIDSPVVPDEATGSIVDYDGTGILPVDKSWSPAQVNSQSGQTATTTQTWGVTTPGFSSVQLFDAASGDETDPANTVYQAFDLVAVAPVTFAADPLMRWDTVSEIALYDGSAWQIVTPPAGGWMGPDGFLGYTLDADQRASTTGVRLTVVENAAAREASTEPGRPAPGSGVASSATGRDYDLQWQLRNTMREPGAGDPWVTADVDYNAGDPGVVRNTFEAVATPQDGDPLHSSDSADVTLIDLPPNVGVAKTAAPSSVVVPHYGDVDPADYPTVDFSVDVWNAASARASYLRAYDPRPCEPASDCTTAADDPTPDVFDGQAYNPATNPFEQFTITGIDFSVPGASNVDPAVSEVALWVRAADGTLSVQTTTVTEAEVLDAAALADVVGVSVVYRSTDPATTGGLIPQGSASGLRLGMTLHAQLRAELRSTGEPMAGTGTVINTAGAQSLDPVLGLDAPPAAGGAEAPVQLTDAFLDVTASKSFSPTQVLEAQPDTPVTVTLGATDGTSTLAAEQATITDADAGFWATFRLTEVTSVTRPAGADLGRIDVQLGDDAWIEGEAAADPVLPAQASDPAAVSGIRFVFFNEDGRPFSATAPSADWSAEAVLTVVTRDDAVFPSTIENAAQASASHVGNPDANDDSTAPIELSTGIPRIDVRKDPSVPNRIVEPGVSTPWTLQFTNIGTSFIGIESLHDELGPWLRFDGEQPLFESTAAGGGPGTLPTEGIGISQSAPESIDFDFPDGSIMAPGDTFTITMGIILLPGLSAQDQAVNAYTVDADRDFAPGDCVNTSGNGQGVLPDVDPNQCGTTNFVQPLGGALLYAEKVVRGEVDGDLVDGAVNTTNPALPCEPNPQGFFRTVCAAYSVIDATDEWRIAAVNTGTVPYTRLTFVDVLPTPGDLLLATAAERGSMYRPVLALETGPTPPLVPPGAVVTIEVTTAANACLGAGPGSAWPSDPMCQSNPPAGEWTPIADFDPAAAADITAFRVDIDYTGTDAGAFQPGDRTEFSLQTRNVPLDGTEPTPEAVQPELRPDDDPLRLWNQVGVTGTRADNGALVTRAPARTGIQLAVGSIAVEKTVSGDAAEYAPESFPFDVACTVGGVPVELGDSAELEVPNGGQARIDGIPLGASCEIEEQGELGAHGEAARTPEGSQTVEVAEPATAEDPVPAAQIASFDNRYDYGTLRVTKEIAAESNLGAYGPWDFSIVCTALYPEPTVVFEDDFTIDIGTDYEIPEGVVPVNAPCVVTEEVPADETVIVGEGVTDNGDGSAVITIGPNSDVYVTNLYAVGTLEVAKELSGDGVERYGEGPFEIEAVCTYPDADTEIYRGTVTLIGGESARFQTGDADAVMPQGTECRLSETVTGGASGEPVFSPSDTVLIEGGEPGGAPAEQSTTVTVENPFDTGEIVVEKLVEGDGAEQYGAGPFTVRLQCSYDRDGVTAPILWDGADYLDLVLERANDYRQTVDGLLVGAECAVVAELVDGGADRVVLGESVIVPPAGGDPVVITVVNSFPAGAVELVKELAGTGAAEAEGSSFEFQLVCMWTADGETSELELPNDGVVVLGPENDYRERIEPLPLGAECAAEETDDGGAVSTAYAPADGRVAVGDGTVVRITVTNTFDATPVVPPGGSGLAESGFDGAAAALLAALAVLLAVGGLALARAGRRRA